MHSALPAAQCLGRWWPKRRSTWAAAVALVALLTSCQDGAGDRPAALRAPNVTAATPVVAERRAAADGQSGEAASSEVDTDDLGLDDFDLDDFDLDSLDLDNLDLDNLDLEDLERIGMRSVEANPLGGCGTCHTDIEDAMAGTVHLREEIGCIECHGPSDGHIRDENNEVKPDQVFGRADVDRLCEECHQCKRKKVASTSPAAEARGEQKVCTDCHQAHRFDPAAE